MVRIALRYAGPLFVLAGTMILSSALANAKSSASGGSNQSNKAGASPATRNLEFKAKWNQAPKQIENHNSKINKKLN